MTKSKFNSFMRELIGKRCQKRYYSKVIKSTNWRQTAQPLTSCVTLSKLLNFSVPQFHYLQNVVNNSDFAKLMKILNKFLQIECLRQCLRQG